MPTGAARRGRQEPSGVLATMGAVVASHATDLWGVVLVTVGILAAIAFYGGSHSLGPAGHGARVAVGDLLGWGRFLVPLVAVAMGLLLLIGYRVGDDETRTHAGAGPGRHRARCSVCLAVAGLAALAGGSPRLRSSTALLSSAGGWLGALVGNPLRSALGGFGATIVLVALAVVAMVLFTGVSIRSATGGIVGAVRWSAAMARDRTGTRRRRGGRRGVRRGGRTDRPLRPAGGLTAAGRGPAGRPRARTRARTRTRTRTRKSGRTRTTRSPSRSRIYCR